jgi:hypothetical protein
MTNFKLGKMLQENIKNTNRTNYYKIYETNIFKIYYSEHGGYNVLDIKANVIESKRNIMQIV